MQDKPSLTSHTPLSPKQQIYQQQSNSHHGHQDIEHKSPKSDGYIAAISGCSLMSIPDESLTHVTTFVADPPSLLALSRVNHRLRNHIAHDNTWYRAFAFHFLGVGPESEPATEKRLLLRRSENTWMKEYITRFNLARRWERSRSTTLNYQPHYWAVSSMHLLDNISLMTANLQYGIVTRSFPLTGKILKGYLDASGTTNGLGIGNPNEEFSPNVACVAMSSCGGTGRIAWCFRNGEVAVTSAPRIMDSNRSAARYARCRVQDEHSGEVRCVTFAGRDDELLVTGCAHGQVKLWETKRMHCLWTGSMVADSALALRNACIKVEFNVSAGVLVTALASGDVMIWWGFRVQDESVVDAIHNFKIAEEPSSDHHAIDTLLLDPNSTTSRACLLLHRVGDRHFERLVADLLCGVVTRTRFGEGPLGPLTSIKACFIHDQNHPISTPASSTPITSDATFALFAPTNGVTSSLAIAMASDKIKSREFNFVLAGDSLGRVCVWNWDAEGSCLPLKGADGIEDRRADLQVNSSCKWEAHDDGAICAIEVSGPVIVTGSTRGSLKAWDSLSLRQLRSFSSPASKPSANGEWDPVGQIVVREDLLVACVGSRVLVWQAGAVVSDKKGKRKHTAKPKGRGTGALLNKWQQQIELNRDIQESQRLLEDERAHSQHAYGRERAQLSTLNQLGLDEREAVEYLLMLSREEEEQRRASELGHGATSSRPDQGEMATIPLTTDDDMDGVFSLDEPGIVSVQHSAQGAKDSHLPLPSAPVPSNPSRSHPRYIPSTSNAKVQVSPPFLPEPTEAGLSTSPLHLASGTSPIAMNQRRSSGPPVSASSLSSSDAQHFPVMRPSSTPSRSVSSMQLAGSWTRGSPTNSYVSTSASTTPSERPSSTSSGASTSASSPVDTSRMNGMDDEDDELKFVLELSLAEARSRGEA